MQLSFQNKKIYFHIPIKLAKMINDINPVVEERYIGNNLSSYRIKSRKLYSFYSFVLIFYIILFFFAAISFSSAKEYTLVYFVYVFGFLLFLMIRSLLQLIVIIRKHYEINQKEVLTKDDHHKIIGRLKIIGYLIYLIVKAIYFFVKLFDIRECFWKYQNYFISSIIRYVLQLGITIFCLVVNSLMISQNYMIGLQVTCLIFIIARFCLITFYFWQFEVSFFIK